MADKPTTKPETKKTTPAPEKKETPVTEKQESPTPETPAPVEPVTLESLARIVSEHTLLIAELQQTTARKRKPVANGKVQIKDTKTGKTYPSKNGTYKALLKSGELKDLIAQGIFGDDPEHNTFGWYALEKVYPGRFEEVQEPREEKPSEKA